MCDTDTHVLGDTLGMMKAWAGAGTGTKGREGGGFSPWVQSMACDADTHVLGNTLGMMKAWAGAGRKSRVGGRGSVDGLRMKALAASG